KTTCRTAAAAEALLDIDTSPPAEVRPRQLLVHHPVSSHPGSFMSRRASSAHRERDRSPARNGEAALSVQSADGPRPCVVVFLWLVVIARAAQCRHARTCEISVPQPAYNHFLPFRQYVFALGHRVQSPLEGKRVCVHKRSQ